MSSNVNKNNYIRLNFNGFSSKIFINDKKVSAISASLSVSENLITFEGAYGGMMNYSDKKDDYFRLNSSNFHELPDISCSIETEITFSQIESLFFDFLKDRGKKIKIQISFGNSQNKTFLFTDCYFKSITLKAQQNGLVTANYDFYVLSDSTTFLNNGMINDVEKKPNSVGIVFDMNNPQQSPIGFWETEIDGFTYSEIKKNVIEWSLNISQNIITKYYCGRSSDKPVEKAPLPDVMIGHPQMKLMVSFLIDRSTFSKHHFYDFSQQKKTIQYIDEKINEISSNKLTLKIKGESICDFLFGTVLDYAPVFDFHNAITFGASYLINQIKIIKPTSFDNQYNSSDYPSISDS